MTPSFSLLKNLSDLFYTLSNIPLVCTVLVFAILSGRANAQSLDIPHFAEALTLIQNGQWQEARKLLEDQLKQNPDWHRARIELAHLYFKLGESQLALDNINRVLAIDNLPPAVRANIENFKQVIKESVSTSGNNLASIETLHQFSGSVSVNVGFNNNTSLDSKDFFINDLSLTEGAILLRALFDEELFMVEFDDDTEFFFLQDDGTIIEADGDVLGQNELFVTTVPDFGSAFTDYRANIEHNYFNSTTNFGWNNSLSVNKENNAEFTSFEREQYKFVSAFKWRLDDKKSISFDLQHRLLKRGGEKQLTNSKVGVEFSFLNHFGNSALSYEFIRTDNERFVFQDRQNLSFSTLDSFASNTHSLSGQLSSLFLNDKLLLLARGEYSISDTNDRFDYEASRITLGMVYDNRDRWIWKLYASVLNLSFKQVRTFGDRFADAGRSLRFNMTYQLSHDWQIALDIESSERSTDVFGGLSSSKLVNELGITYSF